MGERVDEAPMKSHLKTRGTLAEFRGPKILREANRRDRVQKKRGGENLAEKREG